MLQIYLLIGRNGIQIKKEAKAFNSFRFLHSIISSCRINPDKGKAPSPTLSVVKNSTFLVRLRGLEPRTNRLRVYCSTN